MYIIPYYIDTKIAEQFKLTTAWIFMAKGGAKFWETDEPSLKPDEVVQGYLEPNGLRGKIFCVKDNTVYFEVNLDTTKVADFYTWTEFLEKGETVPCDLDVWRPYMWIGDTDKSPSDKDSWGWDGEVRDAQIQKFWTTIFQKK